MNMNSERTEQLQQQKRMICSRKPEKKHQRRYKTTTLYPEMKHMSKLPLEEIVELKPVYYSDQNQKMNCRRSDGNVWKMISTNILPSKSSHQLLLLHSISNLHCSGHSGRHHQQ